MVFSAIENLIQGRGSGVLRTRGMILIGVRKGCNEKVTFEQRPEGGEGGSPWDTPGRENSKGKGPEVGIC